MTDFKKFLLKFHVQIVFLQAVLIAGALYNQYDFEQDMKGCEIKAGIHRENYEMPKLN
jgi:hypothetical protein